MIVTSFRNGDSYSKSDAFYDDLEYDDYDAYEQRQYERDGWNESQFDRQYW